MGNSHSELQPPTIVVNPEFSYQMTPAFLEILQDPSKAKTWVERQVERERAKDVYTRTIAETKTVEDVTREATDIIKNIDLPQIEKSKEAITAKENLEKCYALGFPLNCDDQVAEFKKIASSL